MSPNQVHGRVANTVQPVSCQSHQIQVLLGAYCAVTRLEWNDTSKFRACGNCGIPFALHQDLAPRTFKVCIHWVVLKKLTF